jgi:hypothetical protein
MRLRRTISLACLSCLLVLIPTTSAHAEQLNVAEAATKAIELKLWTDTLLWNNTVRWNTAVEQAKIAEARKARKGVTAAVTSTLRLASAPSGRCGGNLPPCWIMMRESRGLVHIHDGKWQIIPSTWQGFGGYANAGDAPEDVQDAKAASMAACNWVPPNYCGG